MKVLISVYACEPGEGSEPGVGWNVALELAKHHEVWAITPNHNHPAIEAELARNPVTSLHFVYYDLPYWVRLLKQNRLGWQLYYYLWQFGIYFVARELHGKIGFEIAHHVTYVMYWAPSLLALLPVPFVWGPVGGGESAPKSLAQEFSLRGKFYEALRDVGHWLGEHDPFVRLTAQRSTIAQATTEETANRLRRMGATNVQIFSEAGLPHEQIARLAKNTIPDGSPVRFISMGRLLHWKGFHLGLRAFAQADLPDDAEYWILGDGPERERLQTLADELGIAPQVKFWGRLPRDESLRNLWQCFALVHPSLHDSGGWVCLEAMASGRPVVCLDVGGPATQVTQETGFKIPVHSPEQVVHDLADAMTRLAKDVELRTRLGQAGQERVIQVYDWEIKGKLWAQLHEEVFSKSLMN